MAHVARSAVPAPRLPCAHLAPGVDPPRGILLHGPSGCGKTLLAQAIAGELGVPFQSVSAPELVGGVSGESEEKVGGHRAPVWPRVRCRVRACDGSLPQCQIRAMFDAAVAAAPSIIFIDEVDVIAPKRGTSQRSMDKRIVAQVHARRNAVVPVVCPHDRVVVILVVVGGGQLLTCWDSMTMERTDGKPVIVIGATSRPDAMDEGLRRAGRCVHARCLDAKPHAANKACRWHQLRPRDCPSNPRRGRSRRYPRGTWHALVALLSMRRNVWPALQIMARNMRLGGDVDFKALARLTPGYVGADLTAITKVSSLQPCVRKWGKSGAPRASYLLGPCSLVGSLCRTGSSYIGGEACVQVGIARG